MKNEAKADEINVLLPNREVIIGGETVTVREYSLRDSMVLYPYIDVITTEISELFKTDNDIPITAVEPIFAQNYDTLTVLIAHATSTSIEFIDSLNSLDGMKLIDMWWIVNAHFFINAAARKLFQKAAITKQIGGKSLQRSSNTDTAQSESNITPSAK